MKVVSTQSGSPLHIGLNAHLLSTAQTYRGAGINGYIHQLLRHLPAIASAGEGRPAAHFTAFLHDPAYQGPADLDICRSRWDTGHPIRRIVWEQTQLARHSRHLDLLHGMAFAAPLAAGRPTVVTVHDLSFLRYPETFRRFKRVYLSLITQAATRRATLVIAVSESTRQDVIGLCGVPAARVVTVPNGVDATFSPADPIAVNAFRQAKGLPDRFLLFLGTLEPRKNLVRLIEAYARWRAASRQPVKLVLAGGKGWFYEQIYARVAELGLVNDVIFPGFVPNEDLVWYYRAAELFVYPSVFEGFGLPVLEAMASGTPTITSSASSLPEVAGDAALLVDPADTVALADAIASVLEDAALADRMRLAGLRQASLFSWARTAQETFDVYRAAHRAALASIRVGGKPLDRGEMA